jgi:hypothetical protein
MTEKHDPKPAKQSSARERKFKERIKNGDFNSEKFDEGKKEFNQLMENLTVLWKEGKGEPMPAWVPPQQTSKDYEQKIRELRDKKWNNKDSHSYPEDPYATLTPKIKRVFEALQSTDLNHTLVAGGTEARSPINPEIYKDPKPKPLELSKEAEATIQEIDKIVKKMLAEAADNDISPPPTQRPSKAR